jgi:hypothetical protein
VVLYSNIETYFRESNRKRSQQTLLTAR